MKIYTIILLFFVLSACALKVDQSEAKKVAESLLTDLKDHRYDDLDKYYTDISNEGEPREKKIERFKQLEATTGPIKSFQFINANEEYDSDKGLNQLTLRYKVVCEKVIVQQTFLFINDEGNSKIIFQNIETTYQGPTPIR